MMEVFAGFGAHADYQMGRIVDAVKQMPGGENTIFVYIAATTAPAPRAASRGRSTRCDSSTASSRPWQDNLKAIDELGGPKHFKPLSLPPGRMP
jgi:arylsulfatase